MDPRISENHAKGTYVIAYSVFSQRLVRHLMVHQCVKVELERRAVLPYPCDAVPTRWVSSLPPRAGSRSGSLAPRHQTLPELRRFCTGSLPFANASRSIIGIDLEPSANGTSEPGTHRTAETHAETPLHHGKQGHQKNWGLFSAGGTNYLIYQFMPALVVLRHKRRNNVCANVQMFSPGPPMVASHTMHLPLSVHC